MIEVSLYAIPEGSDANISMGRLVDRQRFDKDAMKGTSIMEFVRGFIKSNMQTIEVALKNDNLVSFINGDFPMNTSDFSCVNYWLTKSGYIIKIQNVTDDEANPTSIPDGTAEWNVIDYNFIQHDYPTTIKIIPGKGLDVVNVMEKVVDNSSLFDSHKFPGVKNPLKEAVDRLKLAKESMGRIDPGFASKVYEILENLGLRLFLATGD